MFPSSKDFDRYCPAGKDPDNKVFVKCSSALEAAADYIQANILGPSADIDELAKDAKAGNLLLRLQCLKGFRQALPQLDLVVTPTGVGVVSNENVAPASRDRVDALCRQLDHDIDDTTDLLVEHLRDLPGWGATEQAAALMPTLLYSGLLMQRYAGQSGATRSTAAAATAELEAATLPLRSIIGDALADHLTALQRTREATMEEIQATALARTYLGLALKKNLPAAQATAARLVAYLEATPEAFPLYTQSSAHTANHAPTYEQQQRKEDPAFFFG